MLPTLIGVNRKYFRIFPFLGISPSKKEKNKSCIYRMGSKKIVWRKVCDIIQYGIFSLDKQSWPQVTFSMLRCSPRRLFETFPFGFIKGVFAKRVKANTAVKKKENGTTIIRNKFNVFETFELWNRTATKSVNIRNQRVQKREGIPKSFHLKISSEPYSRIRHRSPLLQFCCWSRRKCR